MNQPIHKRNSLKNDVCFTELKTDLKRACNGKRVYYFGNPGNWGDALIRSGCLQILNDVGIKHTELYRRPLTWIKPFLLGGVFIYGGGGAWCKYYNTGEKYSRLFSKRFKVIVMPSTYDKTFRIPNTSFYVRDKFQSSEFMPNARFCHDLAFYLEPQTTHNGSGTGYLFRIDSERNEQNEIPTENRDFSKEGNQHSNSDHFFKHIDQYETVHTDRLHVAVSGCLLGKETHLYSNSYFKSEAIYKTSMQNAFPNCHFHKKPFKNKTA